MYVLSSLLASSRSFGADKSESLCNHPCDYKSSKLGSNADPRDDSLAIIPPYHKWE